MQSQATPLIFLILALSATLGNQAALADVGCNGALCLTPSMSQSEALFGKIEQTYPQYFSLATGAKTQLIGNDTAYFRNYANGSSIVREGSGLGSSEFDGSVGVSHRGGVGVQHQCFHVVAGQGSQELHQCVDLGVA